MQPHGKPIVAPRRARIHGTVAAMVLGATRIIGIAALASTALAQTIWDGGGTTNLWTNATNWNNNIVAANPSLAVLNFAGTTRLTPDMDANWTTLGISFTNGAGAFILGSTGGFTLTVNGSGIVNLDNTAQTISSAVALGAAQTWTTGANGGNLTVSGAVNNGGFLLSTNPSTNAARAITLSGAISGSGGLTVGGVGSTVLSGTSANTYSGTTTINSGTLTLSKTANVVSVAGNIVIGDGAGTDTLSTTTAGQIASTSAITFTTGGTPTFNLNNNAQSVGSISSSNTGAVISLGSANLTTGGDNTSTTFAGIISGTGGITKNGTGTLTLSNNNTFSGAVVINSGGTLKLGAAGSGGNTPLGTTTGNTTVASGGALDLGGFTLATAEALNISGSGVSSGGALTNSGAAATFSGQVTLGAAASIGGTGNITLSNATPLVGNFLLTKSGSGELVISNSSGARTGGVQVDAGTLTLGSNTAIGANTQTITLNGGNLNLASGTAFSTNPVSVTASSTITANRSTAGADLGHSFGALTLGGSSTLSIVDGSNVTANTAYGVTFGGTTLNSNATLDVANNGTGTGTVTLGALSGNFDLNKSGAGTLALNTASLRNGGSTTLTAGTLSLGNTAALGTTGSTLTLNGGTLDLNTNTSVSAYNTTVGGNVTITSDKGAPAGSGITHTLGNLSIGTYTLSASPGANVNGGTAGLVFGNTTLTGNATFNVANNASANATLTLGAINDGASARTLTFSGNGTTTLGSAATSLGNGTAVNVTAGTLNSNNATALGSLANVTLSGGSTINFNTASQTVGALNGVAGTTAAIAGTNTLTVGSATNNLDSTFGGTITGAGGGILSKAGSGTLTLTGTNTYSGGTNLNAGTVNFSALNNLGTGALSFNGGTLQWNTGNTADISARTVTFDSGGATLDTNGNNVTLANAIGNSGTGALTKTGSGTLTLSGTNTYTGITTVNAGTLSISDGNNLGTAPGSPVANQITLNGGTLATTANFTNALGANRGVTLGASGGTFNVADTTTLTVAGVVTGSGSLTKTGTEVDLSSTYSTLVLTGTNNYTGGTQIIRGGVQINNGSALGTGAITVGNSSTSEAALVFNTTAGSDFTLSNASPITIYGSGRNDDGALRNEGTGNVTVSPNIVLGSDSRINSGNAASNLTLGGTISGAYAFKLGGGGNATASGSISTTSLEKTGSGTVTLTGTNTYGATSINATATGGTLQIGNGGTTGTLGTGDVSFIGGNTTGVLAFNRTNSYSVTNNILGTGSVVQNGSGTVTLSGTNTYTGTTTVNAGTLSIANEGNLGSNPGSFTANQLTLNGGTLNTSATFAIDDANRGITLGASGGTFSTDATTSLTIASTNVITGAGSLTKTGTGNLILNAANTYTGTTTVSQGTLQLNANAPSGAAGTLGNAASSVVINDGNTGSNNTSLLIGASGVTVGRDVTVMNFGSGTTTLGGNISSGTGTFSGNLVLGKAVTLTSDSTANITFSGQISGTGVVTKAGTGIVTLSGTNIHSAGTTLSAGTLNLNNASALGTGAFTIAGGTIDNTSGGITLSTNNAQNWNGDFTFAGTNNLNLGTGAVTLGANRQVTTTGGTLTVGGAIGGSGLSLTKAGAGELALSGANTYTGGTTLSAGTLTVSNTGSLSSAGALTVNGGTLNLNNSAQSVTSLTGSGGTIALGTNHNLTVNNSGSDSFSGTLSGGSSTTLTKSGTGNLLLSGASSGFTGAVTVNTGGTLSLANSNAIGSGTAATTINSGGTLALSGGITVARGNLTLAGTGVGGGAIVNTSGNNTWSGNLTLSGNSTVKLNSSGSDYLALGIYQPVLSRPPVDASTISLGANTLTVAGGAGSGIVYLNGSLTGTGGLTVNMNNTGDKVYLTAHQNTFTGTTQIINGTLLPYTLPNTYPGDNAGGGGTTQYYGINGPVTIGDGLGAANSAVLKIDNAGTRTQELINYKVPITLNRDGLLDVGSAQTIGGYDATINPSNQSLIFNGGNVTIGSTGLLYLAGDVKVNATAGETAVIDGVGNTLSLTTHKGALNNPANADRAFDVGAGAGNTSDLTINATIKDGSITKNGAGVMTITGNNSVGYEGTTTINNGKVVITNNSALGQGLNNAASATRVNSGANSGTLQLQGGVTVSNEWLYLNGNGYGSGGALRNESGNNTWAGSVFLESDSRTHSQAGLLTISGSITSSNNSNLEVRGSGNTTISGAIGTGNGGITKQDSGTLILSGANTYAGATTVNAGVLSLQSASGLGSAGTGTTVESGAELHLNNTAIGGGVNALTTLAEPLTIKGTGVSGQGALRSVSGPNTFGGQVTLGSSSLITANNGHSLTIAGGTTTGGNAYGLTVGTVAENGNVTISGNMSHGTGSLVKNGTGTLTFSGTSGTVGQTSLNAGTIKVGAGSTSTLNTAEFAASTSTTLQIASGGTVIANYASGSTTFSGSIVGEGTYGTDITATFQKNGAGTLVFNKSGGFNAGNNSTLILNGGTLSLLGGAGFTFGTIHITGNTILDFNNSAGTFLSSARLVIDAGVTVTVNNWISVANLTGSSTVWYATDTVNAGTLGGTNIVGGTPMSQIVFTNYNGLTTTWVSGNNSNGQGWFDHEIRPTPEPGTYGAIFLSGCLGLLGWRRFRARQKAAAEVKA